MAVTQRYPGGTELEISMLFVDVRGSTDLAERMSPTDYARLMDRFYNAATEVLIRTDAFIDKFVGDEVMGLYFPLFTGPMRVRRCSQRNNCYRPPGTPRRMGLGCRSASVFIRASPSSVPSRVRKTVSMT